jgi:hypothetical protein
MKEWRGKFFSPKQRAEFMLGEIHARQNTTSTALELEEEQQKDVQELAEDTAEIDGAKGNSSSSNNSTV